MSTVISNHNMNAQTTISSMEQNIQLNDNEVERKQEIEVARNQEMTWENQLNSIRATNQQLATELQNMSQRISRKVTSKFGNRNKKKEIYDIYNDTNNKLTLVDSKSNEAIACLHVYVDEIIQGLGEEHRVKNYNYMNKWITDFNNLINIVRQQMIVLNRYIT